MTTTTTSSISSSGPHPGLPVACGPTCPPVGIGHDPRLGPGGRPVGTQEAVRPTAQHHALLHPHLQHAPTDHTIHWHQPASQPASPRRSAGRQAGGATTQHSTPTREAGREGAAYEGGDGSGGGRLPGRSDDVIGGEVPHLHHAVCHHHDDEAASTSQPTDPPTAPCLACLALCLLLPCAPVATTSGRVLGKARAVTGCVWACARGRTDDSSDTSTR